MKVSLDKDEPELVSRALCGHGWNPKVHGMPCPSCKNPTPKVQKSPSGALTNREVEVLDYVVEEFTHARAPLYREIAEHFGISREVAENHLKALRQKGYVTGGPGTNRHLRLAARAKREIAEMRELRAVNDRLEKKVAALEGAVARLVGECAQSVWWNVHRRTEWKEEVGAHVEPGGSDSVAIVGGRTGRVLGG